MDANTVLIVIVLYFSALIGVSLLTSKGDGNRHFFVANKTSKWYVVAFGMIGASLSGVTFISVPGWVASSNLLYMQIVLGYLLGYVVVANVLLPLYYKLNLTSIYTYIDGRFGKYAYKTSASFFLLSRIIGASFRLYLVASVLQFSVFQPLGIPFFVTVFLTILLIWIYTFRGGIGTIIWTDTLQTFFMLMAVGLTVWQISKFLELDAVGLYQTIASSEYAQMFNFSDWQSSGFFLKQFLSGAFITIVMTGLDQDMMQKNLTCKNLKEAQKNMLWFSVILVPVNLLFLTLGVILLVYAQKNGIAVPEKTDMLYPTIALESGLPPLVGVTFIIGLVASAYSSADSALTSLTTSFSVDILNIHKKKNEQEQVKIRKRVHVGFSVILAVTIVVFDLISDDSVIKLLFDAAGYTYGPLLGVYAFGLFTPYRIQDAKSPLIMIASPIITFLIKYITVYFDTSYQIGFELLIINGLITFVGLWLIKKSH